ncbi:MAG: hypothetical protein JXA90_03175 [Planctomycetes bacterium]|nr:hypothetical protein [Planctomycetota bacterium]
MTSYEFPPGVLESLSSLAAWATKPENVWTPGLPAPGELADRRRLLRAVETSERGSRPVIITVVFTVTRQPFGLARHASVSLSSDAGVANELPSVGTIGAICKLLGFTGDFRSWILRQHPRTAAVSIVEPLPDDAPAARAALAKAEEREP